MVKGYDLGFLLSPLIPEEKVGEVVEELIKKPLIAAGASVTGETPAHFISLAYPIKKTVEHKSTTFRDAYLGAVMFRVEAEEAVKLEQKWRRATETIRHLLIQEEKIEVKPRAPRVPRATLSPTETPTVIDEVQTKAAIDKEIDELLTPVK